MDEASASRARRLCVIVPSGVIAPYIMEAYARALVALGHSVHVLDVRTRDHLRENIDRAIAFAPELAIGYGHSGLFWVGDEPLLRKNQIPLAILHYDCPFFVLDSHAEAEFHAHPSGYHHFVWDPVFLQLYREVKIEPAHPILLAVDTDTFAPQPPRERFDVTYVGRIGDVLAEQAKRRAQHSAAENAFLDRVIAVKAAQPDRPVLEIWRELAKVDGTIPFRWNLYRIVHNEGSPLGRLFLLDGIRSATVDGFGIDCVLLPRVRSQPAVDYARELPALYADSRINLNITSAQLEGALNNKPFDVPAVGGFLLTDWRSDLQRVFPDEGDAIVYHSARELDEKIAYFLAHQNERREIATRMQRTILDAHTYRHRARYLIETIFNSR